MSKPRIALCLYGQYRTGNYCLPWIVKQYQALAATVDVFAYLKSYSTYANMPEDIEACVDAAVIETDFWHAWLGHQVELEVLLEEDDRFTQRGMWTYSPMFAAMQASVMKALRKHATHPYDYLVVQRPDVLVGPNVLAMSRLWPSSLDSRTVYSSTNYMPAIPGEARQGGINDMFILGRPSAMNALIAGTYEATASPKLTDWKRFHFTGPNLLLRKAADAANLDVRSMSVHHAVVRPTADLSTPALQSFQYHERFWRESHKGMS